MLPKIRSVKWIAADRENVTFTRILRYDDTPMAKIFHLLLSLMVSGTNRELARYLPFLKAENKILRNEIRSVVHTKREERKRTSVRQDTGREFHER